ncbi:MAG: hypothetical protein AB8H79_09530 [Myxococcota bacterium]
MPPFIESILTGGDLPLMLTVAVMVVVGLILERVLLRAGWAPYFRVGMPLGEQLLPIPHPPTGSGKTASVRFATHTDGHEVLFWANPGDRSAPMGLHGVVGLVRGANGVHLPVRWCPPFTPFFALIWFGGLGASRGQGFVTIPIAILLMGVLIVVYRQSAVRAARELRWRFVSGEDDPAGEP